MTSLWRYKAIEYSANGGAAVDHGDSPRSAGGVQRGELAGETAAQVRASLRRLGLEVLSVRQVRPWRVPSLPLLGMIEDWLLGHWRRRRAHLRAELYESMATMLDAGVPLVETIQTVLDGSGGAGGGRGSRAMRGMLLELREHLRSGSSLDEAMSAPEGRARGWFDPVEAAIVRSAQHGGTLPAALRALAARHEQAGDLQHRLIGALTYPAIIAMVGLGVAIFLSVKTLPELTKLLTDAQVPIPGLTGLVMGFGQMIAHHWLILGAAALALMAAVAAAPALAGRLNASWGRRVQRLKPWILRRIAMARLAAQLAELVRAGVPLVEAIRVAAPTCPASLRATLAEAAACLERGDDLAGAMADDLWFDAEFRRLIEIGQSSGELDSVLERLAQRWERHARRLIDRLTALLEPCVIIVLASFVGTVAMAAILPLVRLQEVLK